MAGMAEPDALLYVFSAVAGGAFVSSILVWEAFPFALVSIVFDCYTAVVWAVAARRTEAWRVLRAAPPQPACYNACHVAPLIWSANKV